MPHQHESLVVKHPERHDWARLDVHWKGKVSSCTAVHLATQAHNTHTHAAYHTRACVRSCLTTLQEQEAPVATLHKKWGEGEREQLTDADSYDVEFLFLEQKWRPVVFAAALVVDWLYFKRL